MGWILVEKRAASATEIGRHDLPTGQTSHLALAQTRDRILVSATLTEEQKPYALGTLVVDGWAVILHAFAEVIIQPFIPLKDANQSPKVEQHRLNGSGSGAPQMIFLRAGDEIGVANSTRDLIVTLQYEHASVLQVNSSGTAGAQVPRIKREKDEDSGRLLLGTPAPPTAHTEVVQETPSAVRIHHLTEPRELAESEEPMVPLELAKNAPKDSTPTTEDTPMIENSVSPLFVQDDEITQSNELLLENGCPDAPGQALFQNVGATAAPAGIAATPSNESEYISPPTRSGVKSHKSPEVQVPTKGTKRKQVEQNGLVPGSERSKRAKSMENEIRNLQTPSKPVARPRYTATPMGTQEGTPVSSGKSVADGELYKGDPPKVAFSNSSLIDKPALMKFFKLRGGKVVDTIKEEDCNLLCVADGPLKKSMKLLTCIALGIPIITDAWLIASSKKKQFLNIVNFRINAPDQEQEWGFSIDKIWGIPQRDLLQDRSICFTTALQKAYKPFKEVEALCRVLGRPHLIKQAAAKVIKGGGKDRKGNDIIFFGQEQDDKETVELLSNGYTVFTKDFLTMSILRGEVNLDSDEFKVKASKSTVSPETTMRGRKKKA